MGILDRNSKQELMHYGEVFGIWQHLSKAKGWLVNPPLHTKVPDGV